MRARLGPPAGGLVGGVLGYHHDVLIVELDVRPTARSANVSNLSLRFLIEVMFSKTANLPDNRGRHPLIRRLATLPFC